MNLMLDVLMMSFHFGEYVKYFFIKCFSWAEVVYVLSGALPNFR